MYSVVCATLTPSFTRSPCAILSIYVFTAFIVGKVDSPSGKLIPPKLLSLLILVTPYVSGSPIEPIVKLEVVRVF